MRKVLAVFAAVLMAGFFSVSVNAATVTVTFQDAPAEMASGNGFVGTYSSQGFDFVSAYGGWALIGNAPQVPNKAMLIGAWGHYFDLHGTDFSLDSFDFGFLGGQAGTVSLWGYRDGAQVISEVITIAAGSPLPNYATITMGAGWQDLDRVRFDIASNSCCPGDASALDNVVLTSAFAFPVPIPAAAWLFGSALVALGWVRRKKPA